MPTCMDPGHFVRGMGSGPIFSRGFKITEGVQLLISMETCDFPGWEVQTSCSPPPPPPSLRMTYMHASCVKPLKVTQKNVADSQFCKGIGGHGHLKILCRQIMFL